MARQTEFIQLSKEERSYLKTLFSGGNGSNRKHNRARILDLLSKQITPPAFTRKKLPTTVARNGAPAICAGG